MTRKLLFSLVALVFAVFPADAQTTGPQRGFKAGCVATLSSGEVLPDQMDNFKKFTKRVLAAVAEEPGTLVFEFSVQPDGKTVDLLEIYQNAEAFVAIEVRGVDQSVAARTSRLPLFSYILCSCTIDGGRQKPHKPHYVKFAEVENKSSR